MSTRMWRWLCGMLAAVAWTAAAGAEFRAVADNAAVLYDAPSVKAKKLHILGRNYPVEIVVVVEGWIKIRDAGGELSWIEAKNLGERKSVMVTAKLADVRQAADDRRSARVSGRTECTARPRGRDRHRLGARDASRRAKRLHQA